MAEKTYTEQQNIKYKKKLNELLDILPDFCTQYFDSLEFNKQPRTKVAYAMDIKGFFEFLIECIPKFSSYAMKDFKPQDLEKIKGTKPTLLLHVCCGPCSGNVLKEISEFFDITIYYSNSNIYPDTEYFRRFHELENFIQRFNQDFNQNIQVVE